MEPALQVERRRVEALQQRPRRQDLAAERPAQHVLAPAPPAAQPVQVAPGDRELLDERLHPGHVAPRVGRLGRVIEKQAHARRVPAAARTLPAARITQHRLDGRRHGPKRHVPARGHVHAGVGVPVHRHQRGLGKPHAHLARQGRQCRRHRRQHQRLGQRAQGTGQVLGEVAPLQPGAPHRARPAASGRRRRQARDRAGLKQIKPAAGIGPLQVLRRPAPALDVGGQGRQRADLLVAQRPTLAPIGRHVLHRHASRAGRDHLDFLVTHHVAADRPGGLVHDHVIRRRAAADHGLAEAEARVDHHLVARARHRVDAERHAGHLGDKHGLHEDRDRRRRLVAQPAPVSHRPLGPQPGPAGPNRRQDARCPAHVQIGRLLARERGAGPVLAHRARAHRHRRVRHVQPLGELGVGVDHGLDDLGGHRRALNRRHQGVRHGFGRVGAGRLEGAAERGLARHQGLVGRRVHHEARRHRQPVGGQRGQRRRLAAHARRRIGAEFVEPMNHREGASGLHLPATGANRRLGPTAGGHLTYI
ncbi:hypothetical protein D3C72_887080 [compost metagenome]